MATHASLVFKVLGISKFEERFSSNYPPDDHYFLGRALNASVLVCNADDEGDATFPYWVLLKDPVSWGAASDQVTVDPAEIIRAFGEAGLEVRGL